MDSKKIKKILDILFPEIEITIETLAEELRTSVEQVLKHMLNKFEQVLSNKRKESKRKQIKIPYQVRINKQVF
jgi:predicted RNA binding protein with dsRBD fold (UPF0201 family)